MKMEITRRKSREEGLVVDNNVRRQILLSAVSERGSPAVDNCRRAHSCSFDVGDMD